MKKIILTIISLFCFFVFAYDANAEVVTDSRNVILYNLNDNTILYEKKKDEKVYIASLTKIMTLLVAAENIDDLDKEVTITEDMLKGLNGYAVYGLKVGDKITYNDLLHALYLKSSADAANAIVLSLGTNKEFVSKMNNKAKEIGLKNTHFTNSIGKDNKNNYSTVADLATLTIEALKNDSFKKIWEKDSYEMNDHNKIKNSIYSKVEKLNTNLGKNITGSKSGFTDLAKHCLVTTARISDVDYLAVVIDNKIEEDKSVVDTLSLFKYYSDNYSYKTILSVGSKITTIKIKNSAKKINILSTNNVKKYLPNSIDVDKLEYVYKGKTEVNKDIKEGYKLGVLYIKYNDEVLHKEDVVLNKAIGFVFSYYYIVHIGILILLCTLIAILKKATNKKGR